MFPEVDSLPDAEVAATVANGDGDRVLGQDRPDMRRHVVGAFVVVAENRVAVGDESSEEPFEVATDFRRGVLAEDQRGACVMKENVAQAARDARFGDSLLDARRDVDGPAPSSLDRADFGVIHLIVAYKSK